MIRPPLFGKDSSPQYTAPRLAAIITAGLTFLFFILVICIPASVPKQKYETVRIVLDTTPVEIKKEIESSSGMAPATSESESQETSAPKSENTFTEQPVKKIEETPVQKTTPVNPPKKDPVKTETPVVKKAESKPVETRQYTKRTDNDWENRKTVEEQIAEQSEKRAQKSSSNNVDPWAQFNDDSNTVQQTPVTQTQKQITKDALSGSAASATTETTKKQISESASGSTSGSQEKADSSTNNSLGKIAGAQFSEKTFSSGNSSVKINSSSTSEGGTSVSLSDGSSRILLKPKEPKINVSPEQAQNLNSTTTVTISFTVMADGSVPESSVKVKPASLLTEDLIADIAWQLSMWKFEKGESNAAASFGFTIKKN